MKELIFDVMLNGRFICTLKYRICLVKGIVPGWNRN